MQKYLTKILKLKKKLKQRNFEFTKVLERHNFDFALDLNGISPFSLSALYKYYRINDATSKHVTQTETKSRQLRNHRNFQSRRRTRRRKSGYLFTYKKYIFINSKTKFHNKIDNYNICLLQTVQLNSNVLFCYIFYIPY